MCGRFSQRFSWQQAHDYMNLLGEPVELTPRCIDPQTALEELQARLRKSNNGKILSPIGPVYGGKIKEPGSIQTLGPERAIERLDEGIVGGLSGPGELHGHAVGISPKINQPADDLAPVAHANVVELAQFPT